jgi:carbon starvation protein
MIAGKFLPLTLPAIAGIPATGVWSILLFIYAFIASCLPVTTLLQPRDYINTWQLVIAMLLIFLGIVTTSFTQGLDIVAPAVNLHPVGAPPIIPFIFITIACGAVSGFHSLVGSGTSSKQLSKESDALFVGYGAMLTESFLAVLVIVAVSAGIALSYETGDGQILSGLPAWNHHYSSWTASAGLGSKVSAFVIGAGNMIETTGIPKDIAVIIMGVFVASFAGTTLDTATRLQRYIVQEVSKDLNFKPTQGKFGATAFAVITAAILAFSGGANGNGAMAIWPLFGVVNQTLAALSLIVMSVYLKKQGGWKWLVTGLPMVFMIVMSMWGIIINEINFIHEQRPILYIANAIIAILTIFIIIEGLRSLTKKKTIE